jgi:uncharacterized protein YdaU (DUF1376 family)
MTAPYMPLFVADYLADTAHLTAAEHGAYLLLVMNYWQRGKPLPADDRKLARISRMSDAEWSASRATLAEFFVETGGEWTHKRIEAELAVADQKTSKAKAAARASVEARRANAEQTLNGRSTDAELLGKVREEEPVANATGPEQQLEKPALSPADQLWTDGIATLETMHVAAPKARSMVGKWLKDTGGDAGRVHWAIGEASLHGSGDPIPYIARVLSDRSTTPRGPPFREARNNRSLIDGLDEIQRRFPDVPEPGYPRLAG